MSQNRQTLNKIIGSLTVSDTKLGNITQALEREVFQVGQFVQLYLQLDPVIQAVRRTIWQAGSYLDHIQLQLNMLLLGHLSPSVITPRGLKKSYLLKLKITFLNFLVFHMIQEERFGNFTRHLLVLL